MSLRSGRILTLIPPPLHHRSTTPSLRRISYSVFHSFRLHSNPRPPPPPAPARFASPEWSHFINRIAGPGSGFRNEVQYEEFSASAKLTRAFLNDASAFLSFARQYPTLFWRLPREDIEVIVENVSPSLFKDAHAVTSRMRSLLAGGAGHVPDSGRPSTVDLVKFLLSYVHMAIVSSDEVHRSSKVESSVRNLLAELVKTRGTSSESITSVHTQLPEGRSPVPIFTSVHTQLPEGDGSEPRSSVNNMEMKRGDWICTRCSFMNFAKNKSCLQCEELRPKKFVTGGEWECPECNFFNFSRNAMCLRCDCKKPEVSPRHIPTAPATLSGFGANISALKSNTVKPLAESESKQQPWLTKITQLEKSTDLNGSVTDEGFSEFMQTGDNRASSRSSNLAIDGTPDGEYEESRNASDEDLPEIMPMRTGENRFVVSKKKDRSLTSPIYKRRAAIEQAGSNSNHVPFVPFPSNYFAQDKPDSTQASVTSTNIDQTVASKDTGAVISDPGKTGERNEAKPTNIKPENSNRTDMYGASQAIESTSVGDLPWQGRSLEGSAVKEPDPLDMSEEAKAERWFRRVAQIKDISELSQIPDEDFPSIMPLRKGVNRFVVSKRKTPLERRLTSSQYQRNLPVDNDEHNPNNKDVQSS